MDLKQSLAKILTLGFIFAIVLLGVNQVKVKQNLKSEAAMTVVGGFCTTQYDPVCSTTNKTYSNACVAKQYGATVACTGQCPCPTAFFKMTDGTDYFVFKIIGGEPIKQAREIILNRQKKMVTGYVIKTAAPYNPGWSYTLNPYKIGFTDIAMEVCDASIRYVQNHLSEVGGSFLPGSFWCPWSSRLVSEIK